MNQHNDTLDARKRRRETLQNGEYIAFDLSLMDSASASKGVFMTDAAPGSVDSALVAAIEAVAKANEMKPSDWLAKASSREIQQIIESTAKSYVGELSAAGIANGLALDSGISAIVERKAADHAQRFAFMGANAPAFNRDSAEIAARNTIYSEGARASINAIRDARYQDSAATAAPTPGQSAPAAYSPRQVSDALRAARYR
ncbi:MULTISPECIES: hypothetical protein [Pseudomonadota]|uniref:hypothetical protein n=1 Tax=Pseudomonadota TaxID=1224 RepID=UPI000824C449|nr:MULTISPECIES: hypothetical protein [Pseudomonadota]